MNLLSNFFIILLFLRQTIKAIEKIEMCTIAEDAVCKEDDIDEFIGSEKYKESSKEIHNNIQNALLNYKPCSEEDRQCDCHAAVISKDLSYYENEGLTEQLLKDSAKFGTQYKVLQGRLFRDANCMFPARCSGIEYFLLRLLPRLPDMDFVVNTRDWPQLGSAFNAKAAVFSFSKTSNYRDIMYPAWTFWAGGPAIALHPTGIGRWDLLRNSITKASAKISWKEKLSKAFFRGSRTSDERDAIVLLSRRKPELVDAKYTKNQAWKSPKDTLNAEPAQEVSFEDHCNYKYLFNFRGVAASFRFKHLFLCKSLVFHVGNEWNEFFYFNMKPWVHYVPLGSYPTEQEIDELLLFFREHDDLAQQIAERGYKFIWQHLRMVDVECYWKKLLLSYQKLLRYKIVENKELIEIKAK